METSLVHVLTMVIRFDEARDRSGQQVIVINLRLSAGARGTTIAR